MNDNEEPVYRICFLEIPGVLDFINKDKSIDGRITTDKPMIAGSAKKAFKLWVVIAFGRYSFNYTTIRSESFGGIREDATMTGCYRSTYENKTDFSFVVVDYPVHDSERLNPIQVYFEESAKSISIYHVDPKQSVVYSDILGSSLPSSFGFNTWMILLLAFVVLSLLLWLRGILISRNKAINKISNILSFR